MEEHADVKVSVVTVCYNAVDFIKATIESVLSQVFLDYEYVIIDGASTDGTYDIVKGYQQEFDNRKISFHHLSEKDGGIYPAMNKAIRLCKGKWVIFMNAGDYFSSSSVLHDVFSSVIPEDTSVIYGKVVKFSDTQRIIDKPKSLITITQSMPFCHQAAFVLLQDIESKGFDTQFKIAADYDMFLGLYLAGKKFLYVDVLVAYFSLDGVSSKDNLKLYDDFLAVKHGRKLVDKNSFLSKLRRLYFIVKLRITAFLGFGGL